MIYDINFKSIGSDLLPPRIRKPRHVAWLGALLYPLHWLRDEFFNNYWPDLVYRTRFNSQTIVLAALLNRTFNGSSIYITNNANTIPPFYLYKRAEGYAGTGFWNESEALPEYIYNEAEYLPPYDFTVYALSGTAAAQDISAGVDKYKQAGYTYNIIFY